MVFLAQIALLYGLLVLLLILAYSFRRNTNKIFLVISLFFVWYSLLIIYLNFTGLILKYPYLIRTGVIASFLVFPFLYLYSRNTFFPGRIWRKADWLLLLPAAIYVVDFMPFFLMPAEQKIALWPVNLASKERMFLAGEGWLGLSGIYFPFIYIWIAIILFFQVRLIARNWNLECGFRSDHNRRLLYFIATITLLYLPLVIPGIFGILFRLSWFNFNFIEVSYAISLTAISLFLFISPKILYGFLPEARFILAVNEGNPTTALPGSETPEFGEVGGNQASNVDIPETQDTSANIFMDEEEEAAELAILLQHMAENKPFQKLGFSIQELSNQTGIPVYQLSPLINGHFKMNFANWINRYRVEYFVELARENSQMTIEALSREAGFTSRSTFISAFKKEKGITPSEYLRDQKLSV